MQAINSNLTQHDLDKLFAEYENYKILQITRPNKETENKLKEVEKKLSKIIDINTLGG